MKATRYSLLVLIVLTTNVACDNVGTVFGRFDRAMYMSAGDSCLNWNAEYKLDASVLSLEVYTENKASVGFNLNGLINLFGVSRHTQASKLTMNTTLSTTAQPYYQSVPVQTSHEDETGNWNFELGFGSDGSLRCTDSNGSSGIIVGGACVNAARATPIVELISTALDKGIKRIVNDMETKEDTWRSRIVQRPDFQLDKFFIPAGAYAGVQEGDMFQIHNLNHYFSGLPCAEGSQYYGAIKTTNKPLAHVRVVDVKPNASIVQVDPDFSWEIDGRASHEYIQYGALVEIANPHSFTERKPLGRTLELGIVRSLILPVNTSVAGGGQGQGENLTPSSPAGHLLSNRNAILLNVTPLLCEAMVSVAYQNGFQVYIGDSRANLAKCGADDTELERLFYEDPGQVVPGAGSSLVDLINQSQATGNFGGSSTQQPTTSQTGVGNILQSGTGN